MFCRSAGSCEHAAIFRCQCRLCRFSDRSFDEFAARRKNGLRVPAAAGGRHPLCENGARMLARKNLPLACELRCVGRLHESGGRSGLRRTGPRFVGRLRFDARRRADDAVGVAAMTRPRTRPSQSPSPGIRPRRDRRRGRERGRRCPARRARAPATRRPGSSPASRPRTTPCARWCRRSRRCRLSRGRRRSPPTRKHGRRSSRAALRHARTPAPSAARSSKRWTMGRTSRRSTGEPGWRTLSTAQQAVNGWASEVTCWTYGTIAGHREVQHDLLHEPP